MSDFRGFHLFGAWATPGTRDVLRERDEGCSRTVSILGTRVLRVEDPKFLTTGGVYADDLRDPRLEGAGHVTYVRSVMAHAKVTVDTADAAAAPGVLGVFTAADFAGLPTIPLPLPMLPANMARPSLADGVCRYVGEARAGVGTDSRPAGEGGSAGEPLAVVVPDSRYAGEDAAELVAVDYDPLPAVVDPREAARDETLLFPEAGSNTALALENGSADGLFDDCEVVVRQEIHNQRVAPAPLEVRGSACAWESADGGGRLTFWASTQNPHDARNIIAESLGVDADAD